MLIISSSSGVDSEGWRAQASLGVARRLSLVAYLLPGEETSSNETNIGRRRKENVED